MLKNKGNSFFLFFLEFLKIVLVQSPPVLASDSDRQGITPNRRLFSHVLSVACQHTTNCGSSRFFRDGKLPPNPPMDRRCPVRLGFECYHRQGFLEQKHGNPKMSSETIHRCGKCGIAPVYQTATITEQLDDVPNILFRLQCLNCGGYGAYCTTKQAAVGYWNREPFTPPRGCKR